MDKILSQDDTKRKWVSVSITVLIAGLLSLWGIYGIGQYGIALFILTPIFIGAGSTILYGYRRGITKKQAWRVGLLSLGVFISDYFFVQSKVLFVLLWLPHSGFC